MNLHRDDFYSFDGTRIAWTELGSGTPIVLLHGLFSSGAVNWRKYGAAAEIAAAGFRVIMPDFRGHGDSASPAAAAAYPPDVLAMDGQALVRHLDLGAYGLGGYSLGARTAVRMVARGATPGRLVLGGMGFEGLVNSGDRGRWFLDIVENPDRFAPGTREAQAAAFLVQNGVDRVAGAHVLRSQCPTSLETLGAIAIPTLVIAGADDADNGSAADLALAMPNAAYVQIPGNHMNAVTRPDFGAAIAAWLSHGVGGAERPD
jgi:pimeloyl-ACP methyl ester carboxylesterase